MVDPIDVDQLARERYADVEALLVEWLTGALGEQLGLHVSTEMPPPDGDLADVLDGASFWVQVEAFGGSDRGPATDSANVDVAVYAPGDSDGNPDRAGASDTAELLRAAFLFRLPGYDNGAATVSNVVTFSRPSARPYDDNPVIRKFGATYTVTVKAHN